VFAQLEVAVVREYAWSKM